MPAQAFNSTNAHSIPHQRGAGFNHPIVRDHLDVVKYPLWVQKLLYYMIQHESGRHIDFRQMSVSPGQTTANNCKTAFSLHVVESASDDYSF